MRILFWGLFFTVFGYNASAQCPATFTVTLTYCQNAIPNLLPFNSNDIPSVVGTWSPLTISTAISGSQSYTFTPDGSSGCFTNTIITVTVNPVPIANAGSDFTKTCITNPTGLGIGSNSVVGTTYSWSPILGLSSSTISNPIANPLVTTTYTLTATNTSSGCTSTDNVVVTVNTTSPISNAGTDFTKTCITNPSGLGIGSNSVVGTTYSWSPILGLSSSIVSNPIANPLVTTTYTLTATNTSSGCTSTDNVVVTVNTTSPIANAGTDFTKTCITNPSGLGIGSNSVAGTTYSWSPALGLSSSTISNPIANPSITTTYSLTATNTSSGCTTTDIVIVTVNITPPIFDLGLNQQICFGDSIQIFSPNLSLAVTWHGLAQGALGDTIYLVGTGSGNVVCELQNSYGCSALDSISIQVNPIPYPLISGSINVCENSYWELYQVNPTTNYLTWNISNGEIIAGAGSEQIYVHWFNGMAGIINVHETVMTTGCSNEFTLNVNLGDTALAPANVALLFPAGNVLFTDVDYLVMNWGYESVISHIPIYLGVHTQYCMVPTFDPSNYNYWVEVGDGNGCLTKSYFNLPIFPIGIVDDPYKSKLTIFPNPTINEINLVLENSNQDKFIYTIENLLGDEVLNGDLYNGINKIDVSILPTSLYFIILQSKNKSEIIKFIKN